MKHIVTEAVMLRRTDYGEADKILTILTPGHGKLSAMVKGARKAKSKLAGGIELFSVNEISFLEGRSEIKTVTSTRLGQHFGGIISSYERSSAGFEILKTIDKVTEGVAEQAYFELTVNALRFLDDKDVEPNLVELWFLCQLLGVEGRQPNFDVSSGNRFGFDTGTMRFVPNTDGRFEPNHLKLLRILSTHPPSVAKRLSDAGGLVGDCLDVMRRSYKYVT